MKVFVALFAVFAVAAGQGNQVNQGPAFPMIPGFDQLQNILPGVFPGLTRMSAGQGADSSSLLRNAIEFPFNIFAGAARAVADASDNFKGIMGGSGRRQSSTQQTGTFPLDPLNFASFFNNQASMMREQQPPAFRSTIGTGTFPSGPGPANLQLQTFLATLTPEQQRAYFMSLDPNAQHMGGMNVNAEFVKRMQSLTPPVTANGVHISSEATPTPPAVTPVVTVTTP